MAESIGIGESLNIEVRRCIISFGKCILYVDPIVIIILLLLNVFLFIGIVLFYMRSRKASHKMEDKNEK